MRKKIIAIGIIFLLLGIVLLDVSNIEISQNTEKIKFWNLYRSGEYVSEELNFTSNYALVYSFNQTLSGVIYSSSLNSLNLTNLKNFSIKPTVVEGKMLTYDLGPGSYYIVILSNTNPNITYTFVNLNKSILPALLELFGIILAGLGITIAIIGIILKKK